MIGNCNYAIDHRLQPIHTMNEVIRHKGMILEIMEIHFFHKIIIQEGKIGMTPNSITGEDIVGHTHNNVTETNNTHPEAIVIIDRRDRINRVTLIETVIGAGHHVEGCSPTAGRLMMTKAVTKLVKTLKKQNITQDLQKMIHKIADVALVPMKYLAFQDNAGRQQGPATAAKTEVI